MSLEKVKKAARLHLANMTPNLPTAYEAISFDASFYADSLYQYLQFVPLQPDDPVLGDAYYRERIQMQVFVSGPPDVGTADVGERAEAIRQHFKKGTYFNQDGVNVYVLRTPSINRIGTIQNRTTVVVIAELVGEVFA